MVFCRWVNFYRMNFSVVIVLSIRRLHFLGIPMVLVRTKNYTNPNGATLPKFRFQDLTFGRDGFARMAGVPFKRR